MSCCNQYVRIHVITLLRKYILNKPLVIHRSFYLCIFYGLSKFSKQTAKAGFEFNSPMNETCPHRNSLYFIASGVTCIVLHTKSSLYARVEAVERSGKLQFKGITCQVENEWSEFVRVSQKIFLMGCMQYKHTSFLENNFNKPGICQVRSWFMDYYIVCC